MKSCLLVVAGLCACARGAANTSTDAAPTDARVGDGDEEKIDAPKRIDAPIGTGAALLLTEVVLTPSGGEYVEITNPNDVPYSLGSYYLSDAGNYFRLPTGPTIDTADFIVKFPQGATIQPRATITVAMDTAANFQTQYGAPPTYSIASGTGTMETILINGVPSLTNAGELVVLFQWDGQDDLVQDVDIVLVGVPTAANALIDKSGVALDGPDGGTIPSSYKTDARSIPAQPSAPGQGASTKRIALETGNEQQSGAGNGITGDDETSENTAATWDTSFSAPTPGTVPAGLVP